MVDVVRSTKLLGFEGSFIVGSDYCGELFLVISRTLIDWFVGVVAEPFSDASMLVDGASSMCCLC